MKTIIGGEAVLSLYLGKAFSGKTEKILRSACEKGRESGQRAIILVPEGHSHTIERRLCESCGDSASLYAEVLTFKRLSSRVLGEAGGLADKVLDDYSRLIMMNRAYDESSSLMKEYNRRTIRPDVLISFLEIYDELKNSGISPGVME
ncbi:MAG: ATP-dependent nuclease subunit B, partial [Clostridiales bacterium]|nr:ATP-dependent nuclease subunit B [Clostridiales bacterium]